MEPLLAQAALAPEFGGVQMADLPPDFPGQADPADQAFFENAMGWNQNGDVGQAGPLPWATTNPGFVPGGSNSIGGAILDQLEHLKNNSDATLKEITQTLGQDDLGPADMLHVQFQLLSLNLEIQTTSNMAHHGVEDIKTIMRGQ